jgi:type IV pilus assembly protein PilB
MEAIEKTVGDLLPQNEKELKDSGYKNIPRRDSKEFTLYEPVGCPECNSTGYSGRIGVYEVFNITPEIEQLVVKRATSSEVQRLAIEQRMITMRQDGFLKSLEGITTIEEVIAKVSES